MNTLRRIMVVDDDSTVLFVLGDTLKRLGDCYDIVTTKSSTEALEYARHQSFDLLISDLSMPDMNGVELTEAIKNLTPETAVIWITAYGCYNVNADAKRLSVCACRDKPLEVQEILSLVRDVLDAQDSQMR